MVWVCNRDFQWRVQMALEPAVMLIDMNCYYTNYIVSKQDSKLNKVVWKLVPPG